MIMYKRRSGISLHTCHFSNTCHKPMHMLDASGVESYML